MLKKCTVVIVGVLLVIAGVLVGVSIYDKRVRYKGTLEKVELPKLSEIDMGYAHVYDRKKTLPFMAGAILDIDNDGLEELFIGGGRRQADGLFAFEKDHFRNISETAGLVKLGGEATYACVVLDVDGNGFSDLIVSRESGVWLYSNNGGVFNGVNLHIPMSGDTVPISLAVTDINRDGYFDMYVSGHRKKSSEFGGLFVKDTRAESRGMLLLNDGNNSFLNITEAAGLVGKGNGLQAIFVDIDNDALEDLVVANGVGKVQIWKNKGDLRFSLITHPNSTQHSYPMGVTTGDIDNDGLVDLFFTNIGSTVPSFIGSRGIKANDEYNPHWIVLANRGGGQFEDVVKKVKLTDYEIARGAVFEDMNLDGREDLAVAVNHPGWPLHRVPQLRLSSRLFLQNIGGEFVEIGERVGVLNQEYGISPLVADFNGDGYPDLIYLNMGGKSKAYMSKKGNNRYLKVKLPDRVDSIGAMVTVKTLKGKTLYKPFVVSEGLCTDQSHTLIFGLGKDVAIDVLVTYLSKKSQRISGELFNTTVRF